MQAFHPFFLIWICVHEGTAMLVYSFPMKTEEEQKLDHDVMHTLLPQMTALSITSQTQTDRCKMAAHTAIFLRIFKK